MTLRRAAIVLLALASVVVAGVWGVLHTQSGARWVLARAQSATGGAFSYGEVEGSIAGGLVVYRPAFASDAVRVTMQRLGIRAHVDLFPLTLVVEAADADDLLVELPGESEGAGDADPPDGERIVESLALPFAVTVDDAAIAGFVLSRQGDELIDLDRLGLSLDWHERIHVRSLTVERDDLRATALADLLLQRPFDLTAAVDVAADPGLTGLPNALDVSLRVDGSLERLGIELTETGAGLTVSGDVLRVLSEPAWDLAATLTTYEVVGSRGLVVRDVELATSGSPERFEIDLGGEVLGLVDGADDALHLDLSAAGSLEVFDVESLTLDHPYFGVEIRGSLGTPTRFTGTVELQRLALEAWLPALDTPHTVAGRAGVDLSPERLVVSAGEFGLAGAAATLSLAAELDLASRNVMAELGWRQLRWPLLAADARLQSPSGQATLSGTLDDWQADVSTVLTATDVTEGRFRMRGAGTNRAAKIDIVEGEVFGGLLDGAATLDWSSAFEWQAEVSVRGLRTAVLAPAYPGILTARVTAASIDSPASVALEILDLRGTILDEPLAGGGRVAVSRDGLSADAFRIAHGAAEMTADGDLYAPAGMSFSASVPDLARYGASLAGDVELEGNVAWSGMPPRLELTGSSRFVRIDDLRISDVAINSRETATGGVVIETQAGDVAVGQRRLETVRMLATLEADEQDLSLRFEALDSEIEFAMAGSFADTPAVFPWTGEIRALSLAMQTGEGGSLDAPAPVRLWRDAVVLDRMCLSGSLRGTLCAVLDVGAERGITLEAEAAEVPVDVLNAFLQTGFEFEQAVSGSVVWRQPAGGRADGRGALGFSAGTLRSSRFPGLDLETGAGVLDFEIRAGQLLSGRLDLPVGADGFLKGDFRIADLARGVASPVEGSLQARTRDVDVLAVVLPDTQDASGKLDVDVTIGGTVDAPAVLGVAVLEDAAATYFPLGLSLSEVNVRADFDENGHVDLEGSFRAGEGRGEIRTTTRSSNGEVAGIHVGIRGSELAVIDLPDVSAVADADLRLDYRDRRLDINGTLDIPRARVRPVNLATSRVDESEDVVIVSGSLPDAGVTEEKPAAIEIYGNLALGMGNDVRVVLDRASASIAGRAEFEWSGDPVPVGNGRYAINGTVQAFGQVLDISEGAVRFPSVPVTDPLLDIRATREIYGNSQVKRAGVLVQGPLSRPTIEAYTYPMTTEERALTLLVTGNDFNAEQGVGAIDFGTYIAPRLFLSYGVGVFDRENIISARYDLKSGFGIRATSGENASGIDLTYRIER